MSLVRTTVCLLGLSCVLIVDGAMASMIVDLDAQVHHRPNSQVVLTLGPGAYRVDAIAGTFVAWRESATADWRSQFAIDVGNDATIDAFVQVTGFATPALALAAATPLFFSLASATDVAFFLGFDSPLTDNEGGHSLRVSLVNGVVPEPNAALVFMIGLAIAGTAVRSRVSMS